MSASLDFPAVGGSNHLAVLSPYFIPESLRGRKVVNLGDGFILRAIERLLGGFDPAFSWSPRVTLSRQAMALLPTCPATILAGANQLNDRYTVWPGLTADHIREAKLRLIPFGIGLHGEPGQTECLSKVTRDVLTAIHERIEFSSWRCPRTVAYLQQQLPHLASQLLMTGCPVVYDRPLLEGGGFNWRMRHIAVTVTERQDFWARETAILDFVAKRFPRAARYMVLHQNYSPPSRMEWLRHRWWPQRPSQLNDYQRLRQYAVKRGFKVVCPTDADACMSFYETIDMHVGSRLHAHLLCLSRAKRSWLVPVDGRAVGMSEALGFPLCQPNQLEAALDCDFEMVRARAQAGFAVMQRFVRTVPR